VPADVTGTIQIDGPAVTVTTTTAGQNAWLTFSGAAGQKVALSASNSSYASSVGVTIYKPAADGSASTANGYVWNGSLSSGAWTDAVALSLSGTYTIRVNPGSTQTGSITFSLASVPADATGTIQISGPAVTVTTTTAGQNAALTFTAASGQAITLQASNSSYASSVSVTIYKPAADGSASTANGYIWNSYLYSGGSTGSLSLNSSGTWTIRLNPASTQTGSITLTLTSP
jgi:hypothetical protein